ncbi:MAG: hypothetical protein P0Y55_17805 [Candidatus Cohnella colombiensis]|uniref:Uncharacterized protein n=1 Tax=Candidatus Cohnella colombiensis TaxID=3121368 RepID=A0AA95F3Y0_9BACL|nr:MAG: hypothetical protein P0Y55_17805 [Cohnella sp.]
MFRTINTLLTIRISITVNLLIYYIQKLPLIGKLIKESSYANLNLKKTVSVIAFLLTLLWGFMMRFAYVGILVYLPVASLGEGLTEEQSLRQFVHIFAIISLGVACVSNVTVLEPKREKYVAVKLMRLSPTRYMKASLGYRYVTFLVYLLPALLLFGTLAGATITEAVLLTALITLWRIMAEYAHLKLFEKTGMVLIKHNVIVWSVIFFGYAVAYLPLLFNWVPSTETVLLSLPASLVIAVGGLLAVVKLARYSGYREAVDAANKRDDPLLNLGKMISEAEQKSVRVKDSDYKVEREQQDKIESKKGYAYLNSLFFVRHRSLIRGSVNKRLAICGAFGVAGVLLMVLFPELVQRLGWRLEVIFPFLGLIMYFMTVGEKICKTMFYNCDLSLLRYGFYRNEAYEHFQIRFGKVLGMNLSIAGALGVSLTAITASTGGGWLSRELLMIWICVIALSVFFTVHHLFMYYIFQPYSTELNVKNPLYYIVNMAISSACTVSIILRVSGSLLTAIILTLTLLYLLVAFVLIRRYGLRTFRVK